MCVCDCLHSLNTHFNRPGKEQSPTQYVCIQETNARSKYAHKTTHKNHLLHNILERSIAKHLDLECTIQISLTTLNILLSVYNALLVHSHYSSFYVHNGCMTAGMLCHLLEWDKWKLFQRNCSGLFRYSSWANYHLLAIVNVNIVQSCPPKGLQGTKHATLKSHAPWYGILNHIVYCDCTRSQVSKWGSRQLAIPMVCSFGRLLCMEWLHCQLTHRS